MPDRKPLVRIWNKKKSPGHAASRPFIFLQIRKSPFRPRAAVGQISIVNGIRTAPPPRPCGRRRT
ncbi:hypothetical protein Salmuc_01293 [Salipiger mucosus DSM 16094]|uniref:Uncharacterized protein n=1 Tax=Salipiger mucosus DSM 16094 TaxID=1123237 RepID=S9Q8F4_9RHOB|nr:hypothetical protein Salmuc_01293 [Salipiger mucosus DSM 16094]